MVHFLFCLKVQLVIARHSPSSWIFSDHMGQINRGQHSTHNPYPPTNTAPSSLSVYSECVSWSRQSFVFVVIPYFLLGLYCTFLKFTFELILFCYLATQNVTNRLASSLCTISSDICAQLVCKLHSQI